VYYVFIGAICADFLRQAYFSDGLKRCYYLGVAVCGTTVTASQALRARRQFPIRFHALRFLAALYR
jgi:hypothetical protein